MSFVYSLIAFSLLTVVGLHLWLKRYYGTAPKVWLRVELVWGLVSFVSLILAAYQLKDKLDDISLARGRTSVQIAWGDEKRYILEVISALAQNKGTKGAVAQYKIVLPDVKDVDVLRRASIRNEDLGESALVYLAQNAEGLCAPVFGSDWRVKARIVDKAFPPENDVSEGTLLYQNIAATCVLANDITKAAEADQERADEQERLRVWSAIAPFWTYLIAVALALKLVKTIGDFHRLPSKQAGEEGAPSRQGS